MRFVCELMEKEHPVFNETHTVWEKIEELCLQDLLIWMFTAIHNLSLHLLPGVCVCVSVCVCAHVCVCVKGFFLCAIWLLYNESLSGGWMDSMSLEKTSCNLQVRAETTNNLKQSITASVITQY